MSKLYGSNGSVWKKVHHIPQDGEERGILRFEHNGNWYRNEGGQTWKMIKKGRDTWASIERWKK